MRAVPPSLVSRPLRAALLALGLGLGLSAASLSFAQGNMHGMHATLGGHGMHAASASDPQAMHGKMAERRTQRLAALKQKLAITPSRKRHGRRGRVRCSSTARWRRPVTPVIAPKSANRCAPR